jgi:cysteine desulfurase family protein
MRGISMGKNTIIYLDNAASTWPKPPNVIRAVNHVLKEVGANPGRSGHNLSIAAARVILEAREAVASLFGVDDPLRIVFTKNATESLNIVISGLLKPGDHVVTTSMEHNSVMRPLRKMEERGVKLTVVGCSGTGELEPSDVEAAIRPETKAIILTHASNVTGTIMPITKVGSISRRRRVVFCVDAAQTAGSLPIDVDSMNIDLLAFTGHKSLYGPQGTGGLFIGGGLEERIAPLMAGGTGSTSEHEVQPNFLPDMYESGTPNTPGIGGLMAGVHFVAARGIDAIRAHETDLSRDLMEGLIEIPGVRLFGNTDPMHSIPVVSFAISGMSPSDVTSMLNDEYGIMSRPGLHCAPSAHKTIGAFPEGTVRFSLGWFNTSEEIRYTLDAVTKIAARR